MQWAISEYLCFIPRLPMPNLKDDMFNLNSQSQAGFEACLRTLGYEKYSPESSDNAKVQRDPNDALDIFIVGEVSTFTYVSPSLNFATRFNRPCRIMNKLGVASGLAAESSLTD